MKILNISEALEKIVSENELSDLANPLKNEFAISKSEDLRKTISDMEDENRVLKIGIVGRVKAGKSSLLNALIFEGRNILPKAATPMTAALTKLEYGEKTEAFVDFYTQKDINDLKIDFDRYNQKFINIKQQQIEELSKIKLNKLKIKELDEESKNEVEKRAKKIANLEMLNDDKLFASYDQYSRIIKSEITLIELENFKNIEIGNIEFLEEKLYDFVGADGKYMPFTKAVTIKLNDEKLKDIEIIDTPGINDPITSREERTKELLKYCDVILIVSPTWQFLSSEDIELLDRISAKEGIQEIYLIASKVDTELMEGEKQKNKAILPKVIESIKQKLTDNMRNIFKEQKSLYPYQGELFDKLMKNDVLYSSSATFSLFKNFHNKENWDESLHCVWNNLNENYKDYFSDDESAKANLKNLANIDKVNEIFSEIRIRKDEILKLRKKDFEKIKLESIFKYKEVLENNVKEDIKKLETSDLNVIKNQKENFLKIKIQTIESLDETYIDIVDSFEQDTKELLNNKIKSFFGQSRKEIDDSKSVENKSYIYDHGFWSLKFGDDRYETKYENINVVKAGSIRESLENLTYQLEDLIEKESKESVKKLKHNFYNKLLDILNEKIDDESIDLELFVRIIKNILNSISFPEIVYTGSIPNELKKTEILENKEAEQFMEKAKDYVSTFQERVRNDIKKYISSVIALLKNQHIGENICSSYSAKIEKLENEIKNKEVNLSRKQYILKQLETVK